MHRLKNLVLRLVISIVGPEFLRLSRDLAGNSFGRVIALRNSLFRNNTCAASFPHKTSFDFPESISNKGPDVHDVSSELVLEGQTKLDSNFCIKGNADHSVYKKEFESYKERAIRTVYEIYLCKLTSALVSCPDGAPVSKGGVYLQNLARQVGRRPSKKFPYNHPVYFKASRTISLSLPRAFLLAGPSQDVYYHWVWDILPKLKFLREKGYVAGDKLLVAGQKSSFKESFLTMFGIEKADVIYLAEHKDWIQCGELFAVSNLGPINFLVPYAEFYQAINKAPDNPGRMIFIDRKDAKRRKMICDGYGGVFKDMGIKACDFESLRVQEQAKIISESKVIIAVHGSSLANLVFTNKNAMIIELVPAGYQFPMFAAMAMTLGLNYGVIIGDGEARCDNVIADFTINEDRLKSELSELLKNV